MRGGGNYLRKTKFKRKSETSFYFQVLQLWYTCFSHVLCSLSNLTVKKCSMASALQSGCICLHFSLWSLLVLPRCWEIGFLSLCLHLSDGCWFEWHSCAFAGQPSKAPSYYYLLPLINVHFLWLCTHARARSGWIQPDPRCRKSINTIEVLISPPFVNHLLIQVSSCWSQFDFC